jgi:predicted HD phosphohydrolase
MLKEVISSKSHIDEIFAVYRERGGNAYAGERINQLEHALQCALLAEQSGADAPLIVASLLHNYGHLIHGSGDAVSGRGINDRHETLGADRLSTLFADSLTAPIRLHVDAKRYLCATDPEYMKILSAGSVRSLELQGGPFSDVGGRGIYPAPVRRGGRQIAALGRGRQSMRPRHAGAGAFPPLSRTMPAWLSLRADRKSFAYFSRAA